MQWERSIYRFNSYFNNYESTIIKYIKRNHFGSIFVSVLTNNISNLSPFSRTVVFECRRALIYWAGTWRPTVYKRQE
jgi:hypothetical protein